ncbi:MAG: MG2 domain-containing protein [Treponema sp.]|nr:MG2 domain-containing protein [Treponema sp.]
MKLIVKFGICAVALVLVGVFVFSCKKQGAAPDSSLVSAVSSGVMGRTEPLKVVFTQGQDTSIPLSAGALSLRPAVKGELSWQDEYTLVFTPSAPYKPGQRYQVQVSVGGIPPFSFDFIAAVPALNVTVEPVRFEANGDAIVHGYVTVDDDADSARVEETITSPELGKPVWTHEFGRHLFTFAATTRLPAARTVNVNWNGKPIASEEKGSVTVLIPGEEIFEVTEIRVNAGVIVVSFSYPLKPYTDLRGYISLSGKTNVRHSIEGNIVRIFGDDSGGIPPGAELTIEDIEDINGRRLATPVQYRVDESWEIPEIRFAGNGNILPTSQGSQMVVETRNVSGVLVEAFQIYGDNMIQFLQINNLSGERELDRVGEPVWTKAIDFPWAQTDKNRWVRRGLDLSELSKKFPDGMFRLRVTFRQKHIKYECAAGHGDFSHLTFPGDNFAPYRTGNGEPSYWNFYQNTLGYNWSEWSAYHRDPCHPAFYISYNNHNITLGRNVIISDLGLLAKRAVDGSWLVVTTNIITAQPARNIEYRIYNYQGRIVNQGRTGADGMAVIPASVTGTEDDPRIFLYAQSALGKSYLRINNSLALATSHFDVSGGSPSTGIRGLIYGERGVWRPGDDVFLTFLLSDPQETLPRNHPVSFEFEDPRGSLALQRNFTSSVDGFYPIAVSTASDAPTGDWTARVRVGGNVFTRNVKIETVMPNRLKMDLNFGAEGVIKSGPQQVSLVAEWLFGAPAPGLKADVSVTFRDKETTFPGYADFSFRDPSRNVSSERKNVWEGTLNQEGKVTFNVELSPGAQVPGKLTGQFMTRVFEPSGVFSSEQISMEYSPYKRYTGIKLPKGDAARNMLLTDTDHQAEIVILDEDGKPFRENVNLSCAIYKLNWRWWWEKGDDESAEFASTLSHSPISRGDVTAINGKASWTFRINYPEWGRYLVIARDSSGGHAAAQLVYIDWPGWAGRAQAGGQDSQAMLTLTPGKSSYNVGEKVSVSFPSNKSAAALAVVEKGGQILKREWLNCEDGNTKYEFPAEPSMFPNFYVHVTLLQPHLQTQNDLPIRLYGITSVTVDDPKVALQPKIAAPESWQPETKVSFTVSEAGGRPMAYTVAVVDDGLLGLTRFNLPNPRNTFYAKEASILKSWDLFRDIIGAYAGKLETLLAIGGGDDGILDTNKETQRFKPVVRFFGPYEIGAREQKTETFDLPPYIGSLRIMVLAASSTNEAQNKSQRAYGTAEQSVKVASDLMVFGALPRTLSPSDETIIPVYVNSYNGRRRTVKVSLSVPGAAIQGPASQDVTFDAPGEKLVRFTVKAPANPGNLTFTLSAESSGLKTAKHVTDMEVRSTIIPVTKAVNTMILPGETWKGDITYPGREGTNTLTASFSRLPPLNLESRLNYLITYPHGCIEQTTSGAFPQLYLDKVLSLDGNRLAQIRTNVNAGIQKIIRFQNSTGGFSYWPGESEVHDWSSSYAGHFLLEARRAGYIVPDVVIKNWLHYQKDRAALWQARNERFTEQAYRLYTIALAGEADLGSMNRLREQRNMPPQARWRLAAAYWYAGQRDTARTMTRGLSFPEGKYRELSGTFGSALRDKAMILETLLLLSSGQNASQEERTKIHALFEEISKALADEDNWLSTQETAYALIATAPYVQSSVSSGELTLDYNAAGRNGIVSFKGPAYEQPLDNISGAASPLSVTNRSAVPVYVKFTARGLPAEGSEPALSEGLALTVEYRNSDGVAITPASLKAGEDMEVRITLRNNRTQSVEEIALVAPVPASWEIINTRLASAASSSDRKPESAYRYQDIRDDRVMTYFNLNRDESKTISFRVNKTYEGSYFRPAIHAYAMYDESIRALIPGVR